MTIIIDRSEYIDGGWFVHALVDDAHGIRLASYNLALDESANEAALIAAIQALF